MTALLKSSDAFRTISEASAELDVPQHVLRHWEEVFGQIRPMRRAGGRRYYRPVDLDVLRGVKALLYDQRYTTKGVQKIFRENGAKYVAEIGRMAASGQAIELRPLLNEESDDRTPEGAAPDYLGMGEIAALGAALPQPLRQRLSDVLDKLERAQEALDEAALALEAMGSSTEYKR
jgi:DNA-binding transcriptional MerR regulator